MAMAVSTPRRFAGAEKNDASRPIRGIHRNIEQLIDGTGRGDPDSVPGGSDAAVPQSSHPPVTSPAEEALERVTFEADCSSRASETDVYKDWWAESALPFCSVNSCDQLRRCIAPSPEAPRKDCQSSHQFLARSGQAAGCLPSSSASDYGTCRDPYGKQLCAEDELRMLLRSPMGTWVAGETREQICVDIEIATPN
jgi:hypothetical protein